MCATGNSGTRDGATSRDRKQEDRWMRTLTNNNIQFDLRDMYVTETRRTQMLANNVGVY